MLSCDKFSKKLNDPLKYIYTNRRKIVYFNNYKHDQHNSHILSLLKKWYDDYRWLAINRVQGFYHCWKWSEYNKFTQFHINISFPTQTRLIYILTDVIWFSKMIFTLSKNNIYVSN